MSNFPLSYRLTWLPRLLRPALGTPAGDVHAPPRRAGAPRPGRVRIAFVGDLSAVANRAPPAVDPALRRLIAEADVAVANCESPVAERPLAPLGTAIGARHCMSPAFLGEALDAAGMAPGRTVLSLANNHALDQGQRGFERTLDAIAATGARAVGLAAEERLPCMSAGGLAIAFDAYSVWRNAPADAFARQVRTAPARPEAAEGADVVCALPHWDWEFRHHPRPETRRAAARLATGGAGLVVGGHAHVLQPVERMGTTLVAYGLGDFLGTAWPRTRWSLRLAGILIADIAADGPGRGTVVDHALVPFVRLREGRRERLVPLDHLPGALRARFDRRLEAVIGPGS